MKFEIPKDILVRTTLCPKNFACLDEETRDTCPISIPVGSDVCFVDYQGDNGCRYAENYGYKRTICTCPVRKEIWKRYKE